MDIKLNDFEILIKAIAYKHSIKLPIGMDREDLEQEGRVLAIDLLKNPNEFSREKLFGYAKSAIKNRMIHAITKFRYGTHAPTETSKDFDLISYDSFSQNAELDFLELIESSNDVSEICAPLDPEIRGQIWHACQKSLEKQGSPLRANNLSNIDYDEKTGKFGFRVMICGRVISKYGFDTKKEVAKEKWETLKRIQEAVEPIYLGAFAAEQRRGLKKNSGEHRFHRLTKKREALVKDGVLPGFLYMDPLFAMLKLEQLCIQNIQDHTQQHVE